MSAAGEAFREGGGLQLREEYRWSGMREPAWPACFHLDPYECWWERLDGYRTVIVDQVTRGLDLMDGPLRAAIEALGR